MKPVYYSDVSREAKTAVAYIWRSARTVLAYVKQNGIETDSLLAWHLRQIHDAAFEASVALLDVFDDEELEGLERDAKEYASRVRRVRLARHLGETHGRTPEEAAAYAAKAAELSR